MMTTVGAGEWIGSDRGTSRMRIHFTFSLAVLGMLALSCKDKDAGDRTSQDGTVESTSGKRPADGGEGLPGYNGATVPEPLTGVNLTATYDNAEPICASVISGLKVITGCYISVEIPSLSLTSSRLPADSADGVIFTWDSTLTSSHAAVAGKRTLFAKGLSVTYEVTNSFLTDGGDATDLHASVTIQSTKDTRVRSAEVLAPVDPPGAPANLVGASGPRSCDLSWSGDALSYVVVRRQGSAVTWVPVDGSSYPIGDLTAGQAIVFSDSQISYIDGGLRSGISYDYAVFAKNSAGKYSTASLTTCIPNTGGAPIDILCALDGASQGQINTQLNGGNTLYLGGLFDNLAYCTGGGVQLESDTANLAVAYNKAPGLDGSVHVVISDGSNGWYIGGTFTHVGGVARGGLAHLNADGSVGPWNPGVDTANAYVYALVKSGNSIYVGGTFTSVGSTSRNFVAKINADGIGTVDPSWNPGANNTVHAISVVDSTVYFGGEFTVAGGATRYGLAAVNATTGSLLTIAPFGSAVTIYALAASGTSLYIGGVFTGIGGGISSLGGASVSRTSVASISTDDGSLLTFNPVLTAGGGPVVYSVAVVDNKIFLGGWFGINGSAETGFGAVTLASSHISTIPPTDGSVQGITALESTLYIIGSFTTLGGTPHKGAAALTTSGSLLAWDPKLAAASGASGQHWGIAAAGSTVFIGGPFLGIGATPRQNLGAVDTEGNILPFKATFADSNYCGGPKVNALGKLGSTIYVGGCFLSVNGLTHVSLAAFDPDGSLHSWDPDIRLWGGGIWGPGHIYDIANANDAIYAVGSFDAVGGGTTARGYGAAYNTSGTLLPWNPAANGTINSIAIYNTTNPATSTAYVGGSFSAMNATTRNYLGAWSGDPTATGSLQTWNPDPGAPVYSIATLGSNIYVGGDFTSITDINGTLTRNRLAAIGSNGIIGSWNPGAPDRVRKVVAIGSWIYVGGHFTSIGGTSRGHFAAIDANGTVGSWNPDVTSAGGVGYALTLFGSSIAIGGTWGTLANFYQGAFGFVDSD